VEAGEVQSGTKRTTTRTRAKSVFNLIGLACKKDLQVATAVVGTLLVFMVSYAFHCTWVTSEAYSSPSIVLSARSGDGGRIIFDDFRGVWNIVLIAQPSIITTTI